MKSLVFADITTDAFHDKPCKGSFSICHNATTIQDTCLAIHLPYCFKDIVHVRFLGTDGATKSDEFSEKFQRRGGGVIFNPKIYIAKFGPLNRAFSAWKWYKKVFWGMFLPYYHVEHLCYMHLMGNRIIKYTNVPPYEHTHFCHNFVAKSAM